MLACYDIGCVFNCLGGMLTKFVCDQRFWLLFLSSSFNGSHGDEQARTLRSMQQWCVWVWVQHTIVLICVVVCVVMLVVVACWILWEEGNCVLVQRFCLFQFFGFATPTQKSRSSEQLEACVCVREGWTCKGTSTSPLSPNNSYYSLLVVLTCSIFLE